MISPKISPILYWDGVGIRRAGLKALEIREEFEVDEIAEIVAGERFVVVDVAVTVLRAGSFGSGPGLPTVGLLENR
ncbi:MAG TPA: hypothetical protein VJP87_07115 [Candidatus Acidoferrales bacterium]|nr:hypothetical protein [Candidatus Acidoferrales bacterium]